MTTTIDDKTKEQADKDMFIQVQKFISIMSNKSYQSKPTSSEKGETKQC